MNPVLAKQKLKDLQVRILGKKLMDDICSHVCSVDEIRRTFNELFNKARSPDLLLQLLLVTAAEHNRIDVISVFILDAATIRVSNGYYNDYVPKPLYIAIRAQNAQLVELLARAGSSIYDPSNCLLYTDRFNKRHYSLSAIEFACMLELPEMLRILLSHSTDQRQELIVVNGDSSNCVYTNPLHVIIKFEMRYWQKASQYPARTGALPVLVQAAIAGGASVNDPDINGLRALNFLLNLIFTLKDSNPSAVESDILNLDYQTIVDTMRILLTAGAPIGCFRQIHPLVLVVEIISNYHNEVCKYHNVAHLNQLPLLTEMFNLLITHNTNILDRVSRVSRILDILERQLQSFIIRYNVSGQNNEGSSEWLICKAIQEQLADMFCKLVVAESRVNIAALPNRRRLFHENDFIETFLRLTSFPSYRERAYQVMKIAIDSLNSNQVIRLGEQMLEQRRLADSRTDQPYEHDAFLNDLMQNVSAIQTPRRLEHLARGTIIRSVGYANLSCVSSFEISKPLKEYLQLIN